ncbi:hypothetical protein BDN70DRAFT_116374 [Pholiota conissans]|uniref:Peptidase C14 caspase domain-containing protein n=1 Tax=Pholiota conissans TaxID=109636 RepID=A0A9P5YY93_9AGAR|nr:hypothetical protein BDN70DRAFT_116374 [Pholiota conissans]
MAQLGQQALSSHPSHDGKLHKRSFFGGLAQSALGHSLSQGQNQPYSQHALSNTQSQHPGNDPLAGMHLPPATRALLHYAQEKGILDDLARYFKVIPPHPNFCYSRCTGRKKAVCIGINYVGQRDELKGCANDARNMRDFLIKNYGFKDQDILLLIDDSHGRGSPRPTRKEMFHAMGWLVSNAQPHDSLFFHYSGHGGQSPDASGKEVDGMDEVIFPVDYNENSRRDDGPADIIDDELHEALVHDLPAGVRLTAVFDSCHSGTVLDLPYLHSAHGRLRSMGHVSKRAKERGGADAGDVICFAACRDDEKSADTREGGVPVGAMSYAFIQALERNRNQTYEELLQHLRATLIPKYHQKAQISGTHPVV